MKTITTVGDLAEVLQEIGLPMSIRFMGGQWIATIEWAYPDYSQGNATGKGSTMLHAVSACLAGYEAQRGQS